MRVLCLFLCLFIFVNLPQAKAANISDTLQGLWAIPDCKTPEQFIYHSARHVLYITPKDAQIKKVRYNPTSKGYFALTVEGQEFPMNLHNDGILEIGILDKGIALDINQEWDDLPIDARREYTRCDQHPPSPHNIAPSSLEILDTLHEHCYKDTQDTQDTQICQAKLFKVIDKNNDNMLEEDELDLAHLQSLYIHSLIRTTAPINNQRIRDLLGTEVASAQMYTQKLLKGKHGVTLKDLQDYPWGYMSTIHGQNLRVIHQDLLGFFPALKQ